MTMQKRQRWGKQDGAVSLFLVIFATLLITVITISFIQLMTKEQAQATISDLSQSAYDSAQAGVEDAKRVLLIDQSCQTGARLDAICNTVKDAIAAQKCNTVAAAFGRAGDTETLVQQSAGDNKLNQAYTCVKINPNTDDYKGEIEMNESALVPLRAASSFNIVEVSWFTKDDLSSPTATLGYYSAGAGQVKLPQSDTQWRPDYASLLRTQFMQTGASFTLADFDTQTGGQSNANTLFLYPSRNGTPTSLDFAADDPRQSPLNAPHLVSCVSNFNTSGEEYACKARITVPTPIGGGATANAFLRLSALYNGTHYSLKLYQGNTLVPFAGVQPAVDSTGRANDLFRRVQARVELRGSFTYPEAAVDVTHDLCKDFTITDQPDGYTASATCNP